MMAASEVVENRSTRGRKVAKTYISPRLASSSRSLRSRNWPRLKRSRTKSCTMRMPERCSARKPFSRETAWRTRRNTSRARLRNSRVSTRTGGSVARVTSARRGLSRVKATSTPPIMTKSRSSDGSTEVNSSLTVSTSLVIRFTRRPTGWESR